MDTDALNELKMRIWEIGAIAYQGQFMNMNRMKGELVDIYQRIKDLEKNELSEVINLYKQQ